MEHGILWQCKRKMYNAMWDEIDRDPQQASFARVDIGTDSGNICIFCDRNGNTAVVTHNGSSNESTTLEARIEACVTFDEVFDDYLRDNPECVSQETELADAWNDERLDALMSEFSI